MTHSSSNQTLSAYVTNLTSSKSGAARTRKFNALMAQLRQQVNGRHFTMELVESDQKIRVIMLQLLQIKRENMMVSQLRNLHEHHQDMFNAAAILLSMK